jgi:hypothetical protein
MNEVVTSLLWHFRDGYRGTRSAYNSESMQVPAFNDCTQGCHSRENLEKSWKQKMIREKSGINKKNSWGKLPLQQGT